MSEVPVETAKDPIEEKAGVKYSRSSVMVQLPWDIAKRVMAYGKKIPEADLNQDKGNPSASGIENDPHITVRYGIADKNPAVIFPAIDGYSKISFSLGKVSAFTGHPKYDVLKIDVESEDLRRIYRQIGKHVETPGQTYRSYRPHITIGYLKKGESRKYAGDSAFYGVKGTVSSLIFSDGGFKRWDVSLGDENEVVKLPVAVFESGEGDTLDDIDRMIEAARDSVDSDLVSVKCEKCGSIVSNVRCSRHLAHKIVTTTIPYCWKCKDGVVLESAYDWEAAVMRAGSVDDVGVILSNVGLVNNKQKPAEPEESELKEKAVALKGEYEKEYQLYSKAKKAGFIRRVRDVFAQIDPEKEPVALMALDMIATRLGVDLKRGENKKTRFVVDIGDEGKDIEVVSAKDKVLYHATDADPFDEFDPRKMGSATDDGLLGRGVYLSSDKNIKGKKKNLITARLSRGLKFVFVSLHDWNADKSEIVSGAIGTNGLTGKHLSDKISQMGYDGVILDYSPVGYDQREYVVFDHENVTIEDAETPSQENVKDALKDIPKPPASIFGTDDGTEISDVLDMAGVKYVRDESGIFYEVADFARDKVNDSVRVQGYRIYPDDRKGKTLVYLNTRDSKLVKVEQPVFEAADGDWVSMVMAAGSVEHIKGIFQDLGLTHSAGVEIDIPVDLSIIPKPKRGKKYTKDEMQSIGYRMLHRRMTTESKTVSAAIKAFESIKERVVGKLGAEAYENIFRDYSKGGDKLENKLFGQHGLFDFNSRFERGFTPNQGERFSFQNAQDKADWTHERVTEWYEKNLLDAVDNAKKVLATYDKIWNYPSFRDLMKDVDSLPYPLNDVKIIENIGISHYEEPRIRYFSPETVKDEIKAITDRNIRNFDDFIGDVYSGKIDYDKAVSVAKVAYEKEEVRVRNLRKADAEGYKKAFKAIGNAVFGKGHKITLANMNRALSEADAGKIKNEDGQYILYAQDRRLIHLHPEPEDAFAELAVIADVADDHIDEVMFRDSLKKIAKKSISIDDAKKIFMRLMGGDDKPVGKREGIKDILGRMGDDAFGDMAGTNKAKPVSDGINLEDVLVEWKPRFSRSFPPEYRTLSAKAGEKVFYYGDIDALSFQANVKIEGKLSQGSEFAKKMLAQIAAAKADGYEPQKVKYKGSVIKILVKDDIVLSKDDAERYIAGDITGDGGRDGDNGDTDNISPAEDSREPWQMTSDEFVRSQAAKYKMSDEDLQKYGLDKDLKNDHLRILVRTVHSPKKDLIPYEVIKEYGNYVWAKPLVRKYEGTTSEDQSAARKEKDLHDQVSAAAKDRFAEFLEEKGMKLNKTNLKKYSTKGEFAEEYAEWLGFGKRVSGWIQYALADYADDNLSVDDLKKEYKRLSDANAVDYRKQSAEVPGRVGVGRKAHRNRTMDWRAQRMDWIRNRLRELGESIYESAKTSHKADVQKAKTIDDITLLFRKLNLIDNAGWVKVYTPTEDEALKDPHGEAQKTLESLEAIEGSIVANKMVKAWKEGKPANLLGHSVKNPKDLAVLSQVYRNPSFETFRLFMLNEDNVVVGQTGITSRMPGIAVLLADGMTLDDFAGWLKGRMRDAGATKYYLLHNHPSGNIKPSIQDLAATEAISSRVPGMKGHVIINYGKVHFIENVKKSRSGTSIQAQEREMSIEELGYSHDDEPTISHPLLGTRMLSPASVAKAQKELQRDGMFQAFCINGPGNVIGITDIPNSAVGGDGWKEQFKKIFYDLALTFGGQSFIAANVDGNELALQLAEFTEEANIFMEIIEKEGTSWRSTSPKYFMEKDRDIVIGQKVAGITVNDDIIESAFDTIPEVQTAKTVPDIETIFRQIGLIPGETVGAEKPRVIGKDSTTYLPDNTPVDFHYEIRDIEDLVTSHTDEMRVNADFPQERQPRSRDRKGMQLQITNIANKLNPERLAASPSATSGAPIVDKAGIVESGNGRVMAIRRAYKTGKGDAYKEWLTANASNFGADAEAVKGFSAPVLVRVRDTEMNAEDFARKANQGETAQMSPMEVARADAERITEGDMSLLRPTVDGYLGGRDNQAFINRFLERIGVNETAGFLTADGQYTKQLLDRVQGAIFHKAYNDETLLTLMIEEAHPVIRNIINALVASSGEFAKARNIDPDLGGVNIPDIIAASATLIKKSRDTKVDLKTLLFQDPMFSGQSDFDDTIPEEVAQMAKFLDFDNNIRSAKRMGTAFKNAATRLVDFLQDSRNESLLGDDDKQDLRATDVIKNAIEKMEARLGESKNNKDKKSFSDELFEAAGSRPYHCIPGMVNKIMKKAIEYANDENFKDEPRLEWSDGESEKLLEELEDIDAKIRKMEAAQ